MTDDAPGCREDLKPSSDRCLGRLGRVLRRLIPRSIARVNRSDVAGEGLHDPIAGRRPLLYSFWKASTNRDCLEFLRHGVGIAAHLTTPRRHDLRLESLCPAVPVEVRIEGDPIHRRRMPRVHAAVESGRQRQAVGPAFFRHVARLAGHLLRPGQARVEEELLAERNSARRHRIVRWDCDGQGLESPGQREVGSSRLAGSRQHLRLSDQ